MSDIENYVVSLSKVSFRKYIKPGELMLLDHKYSQLRLCIMLSSPQVHIKLGYQCYLLDIYVR